MVEQFADDLVALGCHGGSDPLGQCAQHPVLAGPVCSSGMDDLADDDLS